MKYRILCIDDEIRSLNAIKDLCLSLNSNNEIFPFSDSVKAWEFAEENPIDIALIDIDMPKMNGLELSKKLINKYPKLNIIMTTAYEQYALDAYSINCSGYLLKPITLEALKKQFEVLRFPIELEEERVKIKCFGDFEAFVDNVPVTFSYSKTKELLAYLVDRNGAICSNSQIEVNLWEDDEDHSSYLKQLKKDLISKFEELLGESIFITSRGFIGLKKDNIKCDYFDYLDNKNNDFDEEYMEQYSWAEITKGNLIYKAGKRNVR